MLSMQLQQAACDAGTAAAGLTDDLLASFSALLYFPPANLTPANLASMVRVGGGRQDAGASRSAALVLCFGR